MRKTETVIRQDKVDSMRTAFEASGYSGMTVKGVGGGAQLGGVTFQRRVGEYEVDCCSRFRSP
jgi:nitrogen regulatory protein PII